MWRGRELVIGSAKFGQMETDDCRGANNPWKLDPSANPGMSQGMAGGLRGVDWLDGYCLYSKVVAARGRVWPG